MNFTFGDIVVVDENKIGVICRLWQESNFGRIPAHAEVYVRSYGCIKEYPLTEISRYLVRHKELDEEELFYQHEVEKA
jgi:hypothetical protein